jgi:hypothetical protein
VTFKRQKFGNCDQTISERLLVQQMSEELALREKVSQAELLTRQMAWANGKDQPNPKTTRAKKRVVRWLILAPTRLRRSQAQLLCYLQCAKYHAPQGDIHFNGHPHCRIPDDTNPPIRAFAES